MNLYTSKYFSFFAPKGLNIYLSLSAPVWDLLFGEGMNKSTLQEVNCSKHDENISLPGPPASEACSPSKLTWNKFLDLPLKNETPFSLPKGDLYICAIRDHSKSLSIKFILHFFKLSILSIRISCIYLECFNKSRFEEKFLILLFSDKKLILLNSILVREVLYNIALWSNKFSADFDIWATKLLIVSIISGFSENFMNLS